MKLCSWCHKEVPDEESVEKGGFVVCKECDKKKPDDWDMPWELRG